FKGEFDEIFCWPGSSSYGRGRMPRPRSGEDICVAVIEVLVILKEIVDDELFFTDVWRRAGAATPHLLIEDRAPDAAGHHEMKQLPAVEAGVEHSHADRDLRIVFLFKAANRIIRIGDIARNY